MVQVQQNKQGDVIEDRGWGTDVASLVGVVREGSVRRWHLADARWREPCG